MRTIPETGQLVMVRRQPFVVTGIQTAGCPACHLVTLASVEEESAGDELQLVWELEPGTIIHEHSALPVPDRFDSPHRLVAFINAIRWGAVSQADDRALQAPFRSGIELDDYQLDPVVRALSMPRVNLLIADDVGLGKTIEAGLVVQELILRHRVRTVLIVCPSSLQVQWQEEMRDKFGLEFRIIDRDALSRLRRRRGIHVNPWNHFPRLITSIDFLKRERPLRQFRETLPVGGQPAYPRAYDMLIVDEAHNIAPAGSASGQGHYAVDSLRTTTIRTIVPHFEHRLFLTATPHNGYRESFIALLELLDNQRFARTVTPDRHQLDAVMVRRMKSELKRRWDGSRRFAERVVHHLEVDYSVGERQAHRDLQEYTTLRLRQVGAGHQARMAVEFVLKLLKKRLFSSPAAFAITLERHLATLSASAGETGGAAGLVREIRDHDDDYADDERYEAETDDLVAAVSQVMPPVSDGERVLLQRLLDYARQARQQSDCKAEALIHWLDAHLRPGGVWNGERVILFTEYRATQQWLFDRLAHHGFARNNRLEMIYGGMPNDQRERIKAAFQASAGASPVRILLATDAASEGVNLQNHCSSLIHYEIPWNPNRMEQRNGRVDRHGQQADVVRIYHFVGRGFGTASMKAAPGELDADLEFLMRAALKVETIREDLGKVGPVIARQVEEAMLGQRTTGLDTRRAEQEAEPVRRMLKFERRLREQMEKLAGQLHETRRQLDLHPEQIRHVVQVGLELAGQPPLQPVVLPMGPGKGTGEGFQVQGLSSSWSHCMDGLAHPHTRQLRPVVFDPALATGRDDVVLAHLNHRLVQMCLRLLRAEIWSLKSRVHGLSRQHLSRVSACVVDDPALRHPVVVAYGRIVVLGGDHHRLHEEVITAGGALLEGRFNRLNVGETRAALAAMTLQSVPVSLEASCRNLWPRVRDALLVALEHRMAERTKNLERNLEERAAQEVQHLTRVMSELQRSIQTELEQRRAPQMQLAFEDDPMGQQQYERDTAALQRRLAELPVEIGQEADHIQSRYRQPATRLFPVAVMWLFPRREVR